MFATHKGDANTRVQASQVNSRNLLNISTVKPCRQPHSMCISPSSTFSAFRMSEVAERMLSLYTESFPEQPGLHSFVEGFMGRIVSGTSLAYIFLSCAFLAACSSPKTTNVVLNPIPSSVSLTPSPNVSLEVGKTQVFTAAARSVLGVQESEIFSFQSSNPAVLTIANNGDACAGSWNSLSTPQVCTPGQVGVAQLTATAQGVSSPPVAVYVHQHITSVSLSKAATQPATLSVNCLSKGAPAGPEKWLYEAFAFNGTADITSSAGPFSWQALSSNVTVSAPPTGAPLNQEIVTASVPGQALIFASANGINSQPVQVEACPVQTISLSAVGNSGTSFVVNTGTSTTLNATVTDSLGMTLTGVPLTWSSSNSISARASGATSTVFGSVGTVSASAVGAAAVIASCTPPTCNGGIKPSLPIYPQSAISFTVRSSTNPASPTVYVTTTACSTANPTNVTCNPTIVPITRASSTSVFSAGRPVAALPFSPNSLVFDPTGTNAYLGVDFSNFGQNGLMVFSGTSVSRFTSAFGAVLAVSPDGRLVVVSDTTDTPNQVIIFDTTNHTAAPFLIDGASAAAFSPDNLKAFIVSGKSCPGANSAGCLLVYSKVDASQMIPLTAAATDVAFLGNGMVGYLAGGDPAGASFLPTCDDPALPSLGSVGLASQMIRALPDGQTMLALSPPNVQSVTAAITGTPIVDVPDSGCPMPRGSLMVGNKVGPVSPLGQSFNPTQFFVSSDGLMAYILGETQPGARLPFIIVFDVAAQTSSVISLAGNATPLSASLSPAGDVLFVGTDDGTVHVIDTSSQSDLQQITFPFPTNELCFGPGSPPTALQTVVNITAVSLSQSGPNVTYTYTPVSGPALQAGTSIVITGMSDFANNGTFTITGVGNGIFTVANANGVSATGQSGTGRDGITCNPDLVTVKP